MSKQPKVPETREEVQRVRIPMQIILHEAAIGFQKLPADDGTTISELTFVSPTGIGVTVRLSEEGAKGLVKQLTGVEVATAQALRDLTGI